MDANSTSLRYAVDIVFCIDVTGSMYPVLDQVKEGALSFHKRLEESMAGKDKAISQLRLRVVAYRDFRDDPSDALEESPFFTVPDQVGHFESFVRGLQAGGGGDEPESGLEALAVALNSDWERGQDRRRHIVALFTDASAHPLGVGRSARTYPQAAPSSIDDLLEIWGYGGSQAAVMENAAKRLLLFAPDTSPWNEIQADWNNTIWVPSRAGEGLNEIEFNEIIDAISNSI
jgi:hypothetical protein